MAYTNTSRDITNCYQVTFKGGIPEPLFRGATFPILGDSGIRTANLKEGMLHNATRYWMDDSNFIISPESRYAVETVQTSHVSPAFGPVLNPALRDCNLRDFSIELHPKTIFAMNQYFRQNLLQLIDLITNPEFYSNVSAAQAILEQVIPTEGETVETTISASETQDKNNLSDPSKVTSVKLLFDPSESHPELVPYYTPNPVENIFNQLTNPDNGTIVQLNSTSGIINPNSSSFAAFGKVLEQQYRLIDNLDLDEATQEVFGYPELACIERTEAAPYVPFDYTYRKKTFPKGTPAAGSDPDKNDPNALKLGLGIPHLLRLYVKNPPKGQNGDVTIHFDLGRFLRLSLVGDAFEIKRKRSDDEVQQLLSGQGELTIFTSEQMEEINETYARTGNFVEAAEQQLSAMELATGLYTPNQNQGLTYSSVVSKLDSQNSIVDTLLGQIADRNKHWRDIAKLSPGGVLTPDDRINKKQDLKELYDQIANYRKKIKKDEESSKKIAQLNSLIYSKKDSINLSLPKLTNTPIEIKVVDYGYGLVLFEFNKGKNIYIFKDDDFFNQNIEVESQPDSKNLTMSTMDAKGYRWLIADNIPNYGVTNVKQKPGVLRISGVGSSFLFAYDDVKATESNVYIPVVSEHPLDISGNSVNQIIDISLITNLGGFNNFKTSTGGQIGSMGTVESDGGKITAELIVPSASNASSFMTPLDWQTLLNDTPGLTDWYTFMNGDASGALTQDDIENMKYLLFIKVGLYPKTNPPGPELGDPAPPKTQGVNEDGKLTGIPILFRGTVNVHAKARPWNPNESGYGDPIPYTPHIIDSSNYTISVEPAMDPLKRRLGYQLKIGYRGDIPTEDTNKIPYYLPGKRVDIKYNYKGSLYPLITDGYITQMQQDEVLTVTQPLDASSPVNIHGIYHTTETVTVFSVSDSLRFLEDKNMSENLILESYEYEYGLKVILRNSGYNDDKIDLLADNDILGDNGWDGDPSAYISTAIPPNLNYIPMNLPGQPHSFVTSEDQGRFDALTELTEMFGYTPEGNTSVWARHDGKIDVTGPFSIGQDSRFGNSLMIYRTRDRAQALMNTEDPNKLSKYIYFNNISRVRDLSELATIIKVRGSYNPVTKLPITVGNTKHESVDDSYKDDPDYTGHHIEAKLINKPTVRNRNQLLQILRSEYNNLHSIKEVWKFTATHNPFLVPRTIIFIEPNNRYGYSSSNRQPLFNGNINNLDTFTLSSMDANELVDCAYLIVQVTANDIEDLDEISFRYLTTSEKEYLRTILSNLLAGQAQPF